MPPANATPAPPAAELTELHVARGLTLKQMADFYGVSITTIRRWMDKQSVLSRRPGRRTGRPVKNHREPPSKSELQALYDAPMSQKSIAEQYGVTQRTVVSWFSQRGVRARSGRPVGALGAIAAKTGFKLTPAQLAKLQRLARQSGVSASEFMRQMIDSFPESEAR